MRCLPICLLLGLIAVPARADFPPVDRLPVQAGLPDPLVRLDGGKVATRAEWSEQRRPELKALFQHYMYGRMLPEVKVAAEVLYRDAKAFGGKATLTETALSFGPPEVPRLHLLLVVPNDRRGPVPVFVGPNFSGNHALVSDPAVRVPTAWMYGGQPGVEANRATEAGRGKQLDVWAIDQSIERGYAVATFYNGDVDPDVATPREGVQRHLRPKDTEPGPHDGGSVAAWAWGISRAVDHLLTVDGIDAKRIAVVGHSRLGKAALLAAAFDDRIALAVINQAGCGGSAPSRGTVGESVKQINERFPHWFAGAFKEFNDRTDRLPFDQHCLVALAAPRPMLFNNAVEDTWANPEGQFEVLRAATPVYRLLGATGLEAETMPAPGKLIDSTLGYHIRPGKHSMTRADWKVYLDFADRHLGRAKATE